MPASTVLVVSDMGDPKDSRTWSGTPANLIHGLREAGCVVKSLDLTPKRPVRGALSLLGLVTGRGKEYRRTGIAPFYSTLAMRGSLSPETVVLHTTTSTIPHSRKRSVARHAIYIDSTFHIMATYASVRYPDSVRRSYERFEAGAIAAADHLFAISECVQDDIINHYGIAPDRVTAVGTGLGKIRPVTTPRDYSGRSILFVAKQRFTEKGGDLLLDAFRLAQAQDARIKLNVVATEPYRQAVESIPGATFHSNLPWEQLEALFNSACIYAMPALYEPWGLVYVEALSCRTPILGLARAAFPELACHGECGFIVQESTPQAVAASLLDALSDPDRLARMGERGQQYVQGRYSWLKTSERIRHALFESTYSES
jgi:glycosyltransferase involved in cell wall biosynthesis